MARQRRASGGRRVPAGPTPARKARARQLGFERDLTRRAVVWLVALKIAGLVLIFDPSTLQVFDLTKSIFSRATEWILAALVILLVIRYGAAVIPRAPVLAFTALYLAANVAATLFAQDRYVAIYGESFRYLGLTFVVDMAVLTVAVSAAFRTRGDWLVLGSALGATAIAVSAYVVIQFLGLDPLPWSKDLRVRPFGTLGNPDITGHVLSVAFAAALGVAAFARDGRARVGAGVVAFATLAASGLVATRGSLLGIGATLLTLGIITVALRGLRRRTVAIGGAVLAVAIAVVALPTPLGARVAATVQGAQIRDRIAIYEAALDAISARPVLGFGVDGFGVAYPSVRTVESATFGADTWTSSAHDWILQVAATTGIAGLLAFVSLAGATAFALWRRMRDSPVAGAALLGLSAYLAQGLVTVGSISIDWVPWLAAGVAGSLGATERQHTEARRTPSIAQGLLLVVAAVAALGGLSENDANHAAKDAYVGQDRIAAAQRTVRLDPGRALHWRLLGLAYADRQRWRESADAHAESVRLAPYRSDGWISLARARAELVLAGDATARDGSLSAAREGVRRDPREPSAHIGLAEVAYELGEYDVALTEAVAAIKLLPTEPHYDDIAAAAAARAKDRSAARRSLEDALAVKDSGTLRTALSRLAAGQ